jgi:hypothetical protein
MNKIIKMFFGALIMLISCSTLCAQKMMKLDTDLKANSIPLEAKRKNMNMVVMGKYEFGPYKIVSGKAGWTFTKQRHKFFSFESISESKTKSSFVFIANDIDTILVNTATNTKVNETGIGDWLYENTNFSFSWSSINQSIENYMVKISSTADTSEWTMILITKYGTEVAGKFTAQGILTDGVTNIEIREVKQWEDGKTPVLGIICGYEFYIDNIALAAVQSCLDTTKKKMVWLNQNLDEQMKSVLAAVAASLMVLTDQQQSEQ